MLHTAFMSDIPRSRPVASVAAWTWLPFVDRRRATVVPAVTQAFLKRHPEVKINVISGTGGGFDKFCRGAIDLQNASRPINDNERTACAGSNVDFLETWRDPSRLRSSWCRRTSPRCDAPCLCPSKGLAFAERASFRVGRTYRQ